MTPEDIARLLPLSVLLLGMGDDMHTASLFPGADRLAEAPGHFCDFSAGHRFDHL